MSVSEEREGEVLISTGERLVSNGEIDEQSERMEEGEEEPTSTASVTEMETPSQEEIPVAAPEGEEMQKRKGEAEQLQEKAKPDRSKRKRKQTLTYLSSISKQIESNGNQIHSIAKLIQSYISRGSRQT
jgi:hypothetical protein